MMVIEGETLQRPPQTLRMLLSCGADQVYVTRKVAMKIGSIKKGEVTKVNLLDGGAMISYETIQLLVLSWGG